MATEYTESTEEGIADSRPACWRLTRSYSVNGMSR